MSIQLLEAAAAAAAARASVGAAVGAAPAVLFLAPCWRRRRVTHYALASDARVSRDQQPQQQNQEQQQQQPLQQQQQQQQQQPAALVSNSRRPRALWWSQQLLPPHLALSSSSSGSSIGGGIGIGGGAWRAFASSSARGELPKEGPDHASIVAVPFAVTRAQADEAFARFHSRHWLQNPSLPRWAGQADEAFLPFWVGEATVAVEVHSAEVGRDEVVRRYDARTGRYDTRYETVWRRVDLTTPLSWRFHHAPEDAAMQLFASYKYPRGDVEALRPGALIGRATKITPDMLQVGVLMVGEEGGPTASGGPEEQNSRQEAAGGSNRTLFHKRPADTVPLALFARNGSSTARRGRARRPRRAASAPSR